MLTATNQWCTEGQWNTTATFTCTLYITCTLTTIAITGLRDHGLQALASPHEELLHHGYLNWGSGMEMRSCDRIECILSMHSIRKHSTCSSTFDLWCYSALGSMARSCSAQSLQESLHKYRSRNTQSLSYSLRFLLQSEKLALVDLLNLKRVCAKFYVCDNGVLDN